MFKSIKETILKTFSQYLSIEESKKSIVVLILISITIIGLYKAHLGNDIPPNITSLIGIISGYIFGINTVNTIGNVYSAYVSKKVDSSNSSNNDINGEV